MKFKIYRKILEMNNMLFKQIKLVSERQLWQVILMDGLYLKK